jgi:hypothetical protein
MAGRTFRRARYPAEETGSVIVVDSDEDRNDDRNDATITVDEDSSNGSGDNLAESFETISGEPIEPTKLRSDETLIDGIRRRRGRKPGSKNKVTTKQKNFQESNLEKLLLSLHLMGATFLHVPELQIDTQESAMLSKSVLDVFAAYGVPEISEKAMAAIQLGCAVVAVYGTRGVAIMRRKTAAPKLPQAINIPQQMHQGREAVSRNPINVPAQNPVTPPKPNGNAEKFAQYGGFVQGPVSPFGDEDGTQI